MAYLTRFMKNVQTQVNSFSKIFKLVSKGAKSLSNGEVLKRSIFLKVSTPSNTKISDFHPIALLNVEGKLFFSLISKRLEIHLIYNSKFINYSIQKGCMEKVPGFWEHFSMVWHALKEARTQKSTLATIWLDIANAYGSIPHKLIIFALH